MMNFAPRSRNLLVSCLAAAGLAVAASPALADVYELQYTTASQTGDLFFFAPPPGALPGLITALVPNGTVIPGINGGNPMFNTETTTGTPCGAGGPGCFNNINTTQSVSFLLPPGSFPNQFTGNTNDNLLESFVPNVSPNPPSSNLDNTWFSDTAGVNPGGIAFQAADGTQVAVYTYDDGSGPRLWAESYDIYGNDIAASQVQGGLSTLTDLGAPAPTPGAGYLGLFSLAIGAAAFKLRERLAR
jgi:hypothetical protein